MSAELKDLRLKVTAETYCVLKAEADVGGTDINEIAREVLHAWAVKKLRVATLANRYLKVEGLPGIDEGTTGQLRSKHK